MDDPHDRADHLSVTGDKLDLSLHHGFLGISFLRMQPLCPPR